MGKFKTFIFEVFKNFLFRFFYWNFSSLESNYSLVKNNNNDKIYLNEAFKVVSTQSTAKPGCVLYIGDIIDSEHVGL